MELVFNPSPLKCVIASGGVIIVIIFMYHDHALPFSSSIIRRNRLTLAFSSSTVRPSTYGIVLFVLAARLHWGLAVVMDSPILKRPVPLPNKSKMRFVFNDGLMAPFTAMGFPWLLDHPIFVESRLLLLQPVEVGVIQFSTTRTYADNYDHTNTLGRATVDMAAELVGKGEKKAQRLACLPIP